jgi:hypothetical protein
MISPASMIAFLCVFLLSFGFYEYGHHDGYNEAKHKFCQHGESSIHAIKINGKYKVSIPERTGC